LNVSFSPSVHPRARFVAKTPFVPRSVSALNLELSASSRGVGSARRDAIHRVLPPAYLAYPQRFFAAFLASGFCPIFPSWVASRFLRIISPKNNGNQLTDISAMPIGCG
jgi:hypothetical protein